MDGKEKELKEDTKYFPHYILILTMESEVASADQTHTQILNIEMWGLWCFERDCLLANISVTHLGNIITNAIEHQTGESFLLVFHR